MCKASSHSTPDDVVVEKVFVNVNPQSTLLLGQARGAAITAAVLAGATVHEYTALQVKQAVVGHGKAAKEQVQEMVKRLLKLDATPQADAADALATAITTRTRARLWARWRRSCSPSAKSGARRADRLIIFFSSKPAFAMGCIVHFQQIVDFAVLWR